MARKWNGMIEATEAGMLRNRDTGGSVVAPKHGRAPLVFLHGLLGHVTNWDSVTAHFGKRRRLLPFSFNLYDTNSPYQNVESLTQAALDDMRRAALDKAVVFGNSMGGQIALNIALQAPERTAALVLTGSAGLLERGFSNSMPLNPTCDYIRERIMEIFYDPALATDELVGEIHALLQKNRNKLRLVKLARALKQQNLYDELPRVVCPVLLIWGRNDRITPLRVAKTFADRLPNARLKVLDECGHAPNIERPDDFNKLAEEFLCEIGCG